MTTMHSNAFALLPSVLPVIAAATFVDCFTSCGINIACFSMEIQGCLGDTMGNRINYFSFHLIKSGCHGNQFDIYIFFNNCSYSCLPRFIFMV